MRRLAATPQRLFQLAETIRIGFVLVARTLRTAKKQSVLALRSLGKRNDAVFYSVAHYKDVRVRPCHTTAAPPRTIIAQTIVFCCVSPST